LREKKKARGKANKKTCSPGPWTNVETDLEVTAHLRPSQSIMGECFGTYPEYTNYLVEKGWYPIIFNLTSEDIKESVEKNGLGNYLAASEKSMNSEANREKYGTLVILKVGTDNSLDPNPEDRFLSCHGKTNKKTIIGFCGWRQNQYIILKGNEDLDEPEPIPTTEINI